MRGNRSSSPFSALLLYFLHSSQQVVLVLIIPPQHRPCHDMYVRKYVYPYSRRMNLSTVLHCPAVAASAPSLVLYICISTQEKENVTRTRYIVEQESGRRYHKAPSTHLPTHHNEASISQFSQSVHQFRKREREVTIGPSPSSSSFLIGVNIGRPHRHRRPERKTGWFPQDCQLSPPPRSEVKCLACGLALAWLGSPR